MNKATKILCLTLVIAPSLVLGKPFQVDMTLPDIIKSAGIRTLESLEANEKGLVSAFGLDACVENSYMKISSITELESKPNSYIRYIEVTKNSDNSVNLVFPSTLVKDDLKILKYLATNTDCSGLLKANIPLLIVNSVNGAEQVSILVEKLNEASKEEKNNPNNAVSEPEDQALTSDWSKLESKSPLDDSPSVVLIKKAEDSDASLILRCRENSTEAYIVTTDFLGNDSKKIIIRYDGNKPEKQNVSLSTDHKALFFSSPIKFIKNLLDLKLLTLRYENFRGEQKTTSFKLEGIQEQVDYIRKACNW